MAFAEVVAEWWRLAAPVAMVVVKLVVGTMFLDGIGWWYDALPSLDFCKGEIAVVVGHGSGAFVCFL